MAYGKGKSKDLIKRTVELGSLPTTAGLSELRTRILSALEAMAQSSGGNERLGGISKMGNRELRSLLVLGATSILRRMQGNDKAPKWLSALLTRRPYKVVAVALANKIARIIWVLLTRGGTYRGLEAAKSAASA